MSRWTAADIPDLTGRTAIVTGANSGLGFQASVQLARHGARVIMACRDRGRGEQALEQLLAAAPRSRATLASLDLGDLGSVRRFASSSLAADPDIDILINNAGIMAIPHRRTADGFEMQLGTNFLGHFALTGLLLPGLLAGRGARVVTLTSLVAMAGRIDFGDLQGERSYRRWKAYAQSKVADLHFALELHRRSLRGGAGLISVAAHPGYAATNLQFVAARMEGTRAAETIMHVGNSIFAQSDAQGALPVLMAATAPQVRGGELYGPHLMFQGHPRRIRVFHSVRDPKVGQQLWQVAETLTGVQLGKLSRPTDAGGAFAAGRDRAGGSARA